MGTGGGPPDPCDPDNSVVVTSPNQQNLVAPLLNCGELPPCQEGVVVDSMRQEYVTFTAGTPPECEEFTYTGGSTNFSWSELNDGWTDGNPHATWGVIKSALTTALESTRTNYNRGAIRLSSGYRCPHGNSAVSGVINSLHMFGLAADMFSVSHSWTQTEFSLLEAAADLAGFETPHGYNFYPDHHLHGEID